MLKNLRALRMRAGLSQKQLADIINVSQQSINKYENHEVEPTIETLSVIADYFNTSIDFLVGRTDIENRIEKIYKFDLNAEEAALLDDYRKLSHRDKKAIKTLTDIMLEQ